MMVCCILNLDSPSYPPEPEEYDQCAKRGCKSCLQHVMACELDQMANPHYADTPDPVRWMVCASNLVAAGWHK